MFAVAPVLTGEMTTSWCPPKQTPRVPGSSQSFCPLPVPQNERHACLHTTASQHKDNKTIAREVHPYHKRITAQGKKKGALRSYRYLYVPQARHSTRDVKQYPDVPICATSASQRKKNRKQEPETSICNDALTFAHNPQV